MVLYELHNTVSIKQEEVMRFDDFCRGNGLKPIHVCIFYKNEYMKMNPLDYIKKVCSHETPFESDLYRCPGYTPLILYQTSLYMKGSIAMAMERLKHITKLLTDNGFPVIREKIEAIRSTVIDEKVDYFETHLIWRIDNIDDETIFKLDELNEKVNVNKDVYVPLSFNTRKEAKEVFITLRHCTISGFTKESIIPLIDKAKELITSAGFEFIKHINESVLYDSNCLIDSMKLK